MSDEAPIILCRGFGTIPYCRCTTITRIAAWEQRTSFNLQGLLARGAVLVVPSTRQYVRDLTPCCLKVVYSDQVKVIGREDDNQACPEGTLPAAFGPNAAHSVVIQLFADKGIRERELAALVGAHSVSRSFAQQGNGIPTGGSKSISQSSMTRDLTKR